MRTTMRLLAWMIGCAGFVIGYVANAAVITVNKTADTNDGEIVVDCSLREAVAAAAPGDLIVFSSLFNTPQTIHLRQRWLEVNTAITIAGPGADLLTIDGSSIIYVNLGVIAVGNAGGTVTLRSEEHTSELQSRVD